MATMLETLENIRAEDASVSRLFDGDGNRIRDRNRSPQYQARLAEAAEFLLDVRQGRRPTYHLREAMGTDDFPQLFGDILDRQLLGAYQEAPARWQSYTRRSTVPDFRSVKRYAVDGAEGVLPEVDEQEEYPEASLADSEDTYSVAKHGRKLALSWEALVNDDLDAFGRNPQRLARAARRSELDFVTRLFVDSDGPDSTLYATDHGPDSDESNIVSGNPSLDTVALQDAITLLNSQTDEDGEPIIVEAMVLVVPPALELTANNIVDTQEFRVNENSSGETRIISGNGLGSTNLEVVVNHYIPQVASSNGDTSWFLFGSPSAGRPALEIGFLRGYEEPALFEKVPNARRVAGGEGLVDFDTDSKEWKVRHVFGGTSLVTTGGFRTTVASDGTGG